MWKFILSVFLFSIIFWHWQKCFQIVPSCWIYFLILVPLRDPFWGCLSSVVFWGAPHLLKVSDNVFAIFSCQHKQILMAFPMGKVHCAHIQFSPAFCIYLPIKFRDHIWLKWFFRLWIAAILELTYRGKKTLITSKWFHIFTNGQNYFQIYRVMYRSYIFFFK